MILVGEKALSMQEEGISCIMSDDLYIEGTELCADINIG